MWCRNSKRIAFHSKLRSQERYDLMKNIYYRFDMMIYPVPKCYDLYLRDVSYRNMPNEIFYDDISSPAKERNQNECSTSNIKTKHYKDQQALMILALGIAFFMVGFGVATWIIRGST